MSYKIFSGNNNEIEYINAINKNTEVNEKISDFSNLDIDLKEINRLYCVADKLSISNATAYKKILFLIALLGTLITFFFLMYDEVNIYGMIICVGILLLFLFILNNYASKSNHHQKYLEYRILSESLRVQFYLTYCNVNKNVSDYLPWSTKTNTPWIENVLKQITFVNNNRKNSIKDIWIIDQKKYHERALNKASIDNNINNSISKIVLVMTITTYISTLLFELFIFKKSEFLFNNDTIRAILKIILGTLSAINLFLSSYYGKMSLDNLINDHKRMISLYDRALELIEQKGENEEIISFLARESCNENSNWYAYQLKNKIDINI